MVIFFVWQGVALGCGNRLFDCKQLIFKIHAFFPLRLAIGDATQLITIAAQKKWYLPRLFNALPHQRTAIVGRPITKKKRPTEVSPHHR